MAIDFNVYITDEACSRARSTSLDGGWYLAPTRWAISNISNEAVNQHRTSDSVNTSGIWVTQPYSAVTKYQNKSLLHSIVIPPDASQILQPIKEIYFFYNDAYGKEFLFAIAEPVSTLSFAPGVSQSYKFLFSLNNNNTDLVDITSINYTYPQDIEDHNVNIDAHDYLLARDGSRTATDVLRYATHVSFENDRDIIDKGYLDESLFDFRKYVDNSIPVGTVAWWPTDSPPQYWMERNGAALSREAYPQLFAVLGTKYGEGDGSTTFNIPYDLQGRFIESQDAGKNVGTLRPYNFNDTTATTIRSRVYMPIIKVRSTNVITQEGHATEFEYYYVGQVIGEYTVPGTYYLDVMMDGEYEIEVVSAGAGGHGTIASTGGGGVYIETVGGTGAYYKNIFQLKKSTYYITIGAGGPPHASYTGIGGEATTFDEILSLGGAEGYQWPANYGATPEPIKPPIGGEGGSLIYANNAVGTPIYKAGYDAYGTIAQPITTYPNQIGPQSEYGLSEYGQGGGGQPNGYYIESFAGTGGYLKITYNGIWQ